MSGSCKILTPTRWNGPPTGIGCKSGQKVLRLLFRDAQIKQALQNLCTITIRNILVRHKHSWQTGDGQSDLRVLLEAKQNTFQSESRHTSGKEKQDLHDTELLPPRIVGFPRQSYGKASLWKGYHFVTLVGKLASWNMLSNFLKLFSLNRNAISNHLCPFHTHDLTISMIILS